MQVAAMTEEDGRFVCGWVHEVVLFGATLDLLSQYRTCSSRCTIGTCIFSQEPDRGFLRSTPGHLWTMFATSALCVRSTVELLHIRAQTMSRLPSIGPFFLVDVFQMRHWQLHNARPFGGSVASNYQRKRKSWTVSSNSGGL
jgi:hypothetical protein